MLYLHLSRPGGSIAVLGKFELTKFSQNFTDSYILNGLHHAVLSSANFDNCGIQVHTTLEVLNKITFEKP